MAIRDKQAVSLRTREGGHDFKNSCMTISLGIDAEKLEVSDIADGNVRLDNNGAES